MKNLKKILLISLLLALPLSLFACSEGADEAPTDETISDIKEDAYNEKIAYCMAQIQELTDRLAAEKEQNYLDTSAYELQIAALEQTIASLKSQLQENSTPVLKPEDTTTAEQIPYTYIKEDNCVTITKYTGDNEVVTIPAKIENFPVVCIGEGAFKGTAVKAVTIPDGVKTLDWFAFSSCTRLSEITIPSSVGRIEYGAFDGAKQNFVIKCKENSFAHKYALSWGYICVAE